MKITLNEQFNKPIEFQQLAIGQTFIWTTPHLDTIAKAINNNFSIGIKLTPTSWFSFHENNIREVLDDRYKVLPIKIEEIVISRI